MEITSEVATGEFDLVRDGWEINTGSGVIQGDRLFRRVSWIDRSTARGGALEPPRAASRYRTRTHLKTSPTVSKRSTAMPSESSSYTFVRPQSS